MRQNMPDVLRPGELKRKRLSRGSVTRRSSSIYVIQPTFSVPSTRAAGRWRVGACPHASHRHPFRNRRDVPRGYPSGKKRKHAGRHQFTSSSRLSPSLDTGRREEKATRRWREPVRVHMLPSETDGTFPEVIHEAKHAGCTSPWGIKTKAAQSWIR
jgi:hypothetical protein